MSKLNRSKTDLWLLLRGAVIGRDDRIWTRDILYPKQTRYQAALHPFQLVYSIIVENLRLVFHILILFSPFICKMDLVTYNNKWIFFSGILRRKGLLFLKAEKGKKILSTKSLHMSIWIRDSAQKYKGSLTTYTSLNIMYSNMEYKKKKEDSQCEI